MACTRLGAFAAIGLGFVACHVYDPKDLVGAGAKSGGSGAGSAGTTASTSGGSASTAGTGTGGSAVSGGDGSGGLTGGTDNNGGDSSMAEGGGGGEPDLTGGTGGSGMGGSSGAGGSSGGSAGSGGKGGSAGDAGSSAGTGGSSGGTGGSSGVGSGGAGSGGAGSGGLDGSGGASGSGASGAGSSGVGGSGGSGIVELAHGKTATADSEENKPSSNPPKVNLAPNGNDADAATRWCAADGSPHYWQVDLGASYTLSRVEIDFEYPTQAMGSAYLYVVGTSADGSSFSTAIDKSANTDSTTTQTADFPASTSARYVRITITPPVTTPSPTWPSFWEARVYGQ